MLASASSSISLSDHPKQASVMLLPYVAIRLSNRLVALKVALDHHASNRRVSIPSLIHDTLTDANLLRMVLLTVGMTQSTMRPLLGLHFPKKFRFTDTRNRIWFEPTRKMRWAVRISSGSNNVMEPVFVTDRK